MIKSLMFWFMGTGWKEVKLLSSCLYCILAGTIYAMKATFILVVIMILAHFRPHGLFLKINGALYKIKSLSVSLTKDKIVPL